MGASVRVLFTDDHVALTLDEEAGLVRYVRTRQRFPSMDVLRLVHEAIVSALPSGSQARLKLLIDVRAAPPRNDEAFEAEIARAFSGFLPRFAAHAVLVKSAAGRLQVQRLRGGRVGVFETEADALRYLGITAG
jgi:hypothetical protein